MSEPRRPNVIVFFTDQQRADTTGLHGNPLGLTPNLDHYANAGTHLQNSFTCQPVCGPARASLQTGRYATSLGCFRNGVPLPEGQQTLAHRFAEAGYATSYIGKWHLSAPGTHGPVAPEHRGGYEYWLAANILEFTSTAYSTTLYDNENQPTTLPGYRADAVTDAAIRYVHEHADEPFYLFISYVEPHHQNSTGDFPAPRDYYNRYVDGWTPPDLAALIGSAPQDLPGYYGMVKRLDEGFGRLMDALESMSIDDQTVVLFTSDHGCHFRTRNTEFKRSAHDASIRVPSVLLGPGFDRGVTIQEPVSTVDLTATLLDTAGLAPLEGMHGRSVLQLIQGNGDWPSEAFVQISESQVGRAVRTRRWKYAVVAPDADGMTAAGASEYREDCLYDLDTDPYELTNLIELASHREVAVVMRERLIRRMVEAGEAEPRIQQTSTVEPPPLDPRRQLHVSVEEAHQ